MKTTRERVVRTTCRRGHPRTPETTYSYPRKDGTMRVMCRVCNASKSKTALPIAHCFTPNLWHGDLTTSYIALASGKTAIINTQDLQSVIAHSRWAAGGSNSNYVCSIVSGKDACPSISLHRFIMQAKDGEVIDHINRNTLDNRRDNLRVITTQQNIQNQTIIGRRNGSGYKNVIWIKSVNRWRVVVCHSGKQYNGGHFTDYDTACASASVLRQKLHSHCPENSLPVNG